MARWRRNDETSYLKVKTNILLKQVNEFNCSCALDLNGTQCEIGTRCECDQVVTHTSYRAEMCQSIGKWQSCGENSNKKVLVNPLHPKSDL